MQHARERHRRVQHAAGREFVRVQLPALDHQLFQRANQICNIERRR
jgi:hypothetical protein